MKRQFVLFSVCLGINLTLAYAAPISQSEAETIALNGMKQHGVVNAKATKAYKPGKLSAKTYRDQTWQPHDSFHVINVEPTGFAVVAWDDIAHPIVFFAEQGAYTGQDLPPQFREMLRAAAAEIDAAIASREAPDARIVAAWTQARDTNDFPVHAARAEKKQVLPLLDAEWDQGRYYNADCPDDPAGEAGHALVGCVAVAMAQLMHYHRHPARGDGYHSYDHPEYGRIHANFGATTYNWSSMPDSLTAHDGDVAELLFHCGVSIEMNYGPKSSGASSSDVDDALETYFRYNRKADYKDREDYSDSAWCALLRGELDAGRPLLYRGVGSGHHAFNIDGYKDTNYFHVNWGWGGSYNGYFFLHDLTPGNHDYNDDHGAIVGIEPEAGDDAYEENDTRTSAYDFTSSRTWLSSIAGRGVQADDDWYEIKVGPAGYERVQVSCMFTHGDGDIDIGLYDSGGNRLAASAGTQNNEFINHVVPSAGTYYIRVYYADEGNTYDLWWDDSKPLLSSEAVPVDFDGDGAADIAGFWPQAALWDFIYSSSGNYDWAGYGWSAVKPVPADYDGDGQTDLAVYHPAGGKWYIRQSSGGDRTESFGWSASIPLPGDYDGDGQADLAVFYRPTARWYFRYSRGGPDASVGFGWSAVLPVPADYDGDGVTDLGVYHPASGNWYCHESSTGNVVQKQLGGGRALPVPADYDGDGAADVAVFTRATAQWQVAYSGGGSLAMAFGWSAVLPVPADYDGDGKADVAIYHPAGGKWYILKSTNGKTDVQDLGGTGCMPVLLYPLIHSWYRLP